MTRLLAAVLCVLLLPASLGAQLGLPTGPSADWQQWDAFLTNAIKTLGDELGEARREQLRDLFLDSRYQLVQALSSGGADPVPRLFLDSWGRLGPILRQALPELPADTATRYSGFISVMDGATSVGGFMQGLGLLRVTPDTLRSASALLGTSAADPLAYTLDVDGGLRALLGFAGMPGTPRLSPAIEQSRLRSPAAWRALLVAPAFAAPAFAAPAFAAEDEFDRLNEWVPATREVPGYLTQVRRLLTQASAAALAKGKLAPQHHALYRQVVFAAGWQESCWRQFVRSGEKLTPLASATGDVGLMQVNRNTWRGLYDVKGLSGDIAYNANAGSEILLYYLSRYAVRKAEDRQPGGHLARATYSAYNGGPGQLGRYRNPKTPAVWKKVDEAFWTKFRTVSGGQELGVRACYAR